jgi:hypothetical protein
MFGGINHKMIEYTMQVDANERNLSGAQLGALDPAALKAEFARAYAQLRRELVEPQDLEPPPASL